jgi:serine O-acetyltransferase
VPFVERIVRLRTRRGLRLVIREAMALYGLEIPPEVKIGPDLILPHRAVGTIINPHTTIGARAMIYHNVTIGRRDSYRRGTIGHIYLGDDVVLCPGCVLLAGESGMRVGSGTVIGANSVLTRDTGCWEIWAGAPAVKVGERDPRSAIQLLHRPPPSIASRSGRR